MQLFQRRRWIHPGRVDEGLDAFVRQLAWIDAHTGLSMAGWRVDGLDAEPAAEPGAILATTIYDDHAWFLGEVARLQTLVGYQPVNDATEALTVGTDAFERWDPPADLAGDWSFGDASFLQGTGMGDVAPDGLVWRNVEGAEGLVAWFPSGDQPVATGERTRMERWLRIH